MALRLLETHKTLDIRRKMLREGKMATYLKRIEARFIREKVEGYDKPIMSTKDAYQLFKYLQDETKEKMIGVYLDGQNKVVCFDIVAMGGVQSSHVSVREVIKPAVLSGAVGLIIIHNHPSGNPEASDADIELTLIIKKACELMELNLLDHIIVGLDSYYSFNDEGRL